MEHPPIWMVFTRKFAEPEIICQICETLLPHKIEAQVLLNAFSWNHLQSTSPPPKNEYHFQPDIMSDTAQTNANLETVHSSYGTSTPSNWSWTWRFFGDPLKISKRWRSLNLWKRHLTIPKGSLWITWCFYNFRSVLVFLTFFNPFFGIWPNIFSDIRILSPPGFTYWLLHGHSVAISPVPAG